MLEKKSQSEIIRDHINAQFEAKYDYSTKYNRSNDVKIIMKKHGKAINVSYDKMKSHHAKLLKEIMKKRKLDPRTFGLSKTIPKFNVTSTLQSQITPKPQAATQTIPQTPTQTGQQPTQQQGTTQQIPIPEPQFIKFDVAGVSATWNALYLGSKSIFAPLATDLSESEKRSLGEMWQPIFNKYLNEKMEIVVTLVATMGVFAPHIVQGRRLAKKEKVKEKIEEIGKEKKETKAPLTQTQEDKEKSESIKKLKGEDSWNA